MINNSPINNYEAKNELKLEKNVSKQDKAKKPINESILKLTTEVNELTKGVVDHF